MSRESSPIRGYRRCLSSRLWGAAALAHMDLVPLLNLDLRLGEGTGAALAMQLVDDAVAVLTDMATFAEASVAQKEQPAQNAASSTH